MKRRDLIRHLENNGEGVPAKVFRPEYIIAVAASVGRHKDLARIEQLMAQARIDKSLLDDIL
jgi:hypothetical protein